MAPHPIDQATKHEDATLIWGSISRVVEKIGDRAEALGWDEVINMTADLVDKEGANMDAKHLTTDVYTYLMRLFFRIKSYDAPMPFNLVVERQHNMADAGRPSQMEAGFEICNYDYPTYLWLKKVNPDYLDIVSGWVPKAALSPAQIRRLEKQAEENRRSK